MAAPRFFIIDYCKSRQLKISKTVSLEPPFDNPLNGVSAATSLGCEIPISHRSGTVDNVLSRFKHDKGTLTRELLPSSDSGLQGEPGQTVWLQGVEQQILEGSSGFSPHVSAIDRNYVVSLSGIPWFVDNNGIGIATTVPSLNRAGFGGDAGFKRTTIVANNQEFLTQNKVKVLHHTKHYAQVATVDQNATPMSLLFDSDANQYNWPGVHNPGAVHTLHGSFLHAGSPFNFSWDVVFRIWAVQPAIIGHGSLTYTPPDINGILSRKYTIYPIDDITTPDYGGSIGTTIDFGELRSGAHLYGFFDESGSPDVNVTINTEVVNGTFGGTAMPTPQFSGGTSLFPNTNYNTVKIYPSRSITQWHVSVSSPNHAILGAPDPVDLGTVTMFPTPVDGLLYEGHLRLQAQKF